MCQFCLNHKLVKKIIKRLQVFNLGNPNMGVKLNKPCQIINKPVWHPSALLVLSIKDFMFLALDQTTFQ